MSRKRKRPSRRHKTDQMDIQVRNSGTNNENMDPSGAEQRPYEPLNRILVIYRRVGAYQYGAISKMGGNPDHLEWHSPFLISKSNSAGEEEVYGTVRGTLKRIADQLAKFEAFHKRTSQRLSDVGIAVDQNHLLPSSDVANSIIEEQDALIEEVVLITSIHVRQLHEIFPSLKKFRVAVYDYEGRPAGRTSLKHVGDLMAHTRYIAIRDGRIVDLMSNKKHLAHHQTGLQLDFMEYLRCVIELVESITVKRLATMLRGRVKKLSVSSPISDIIFLMQNLYTLGGFVIKHGTPVSPPVRTILDQLAPDLYEQELHARGLPAGSAATIQAVFTNPKFQFEGNLEDKKIKTVMTVNGQTETLVTGYEQFFQDVTTAAGKNSLLSLTTSLRPASKLDSGGL